jgi:hypothetical protein
MKLQFPHRTIGIEPRSRKDLVAAPHSLQGGHFAPLAIAVTGSGINVEWFLCLLRKTLRSNCHEGNREPPHARTYSVLAACYDAEEETPARSSVVSRFDCERGSVLAALPANV